MKEDKIIQLLSSPNVQDMKLGFEFGIKLLGEERLINLVKTIRFSHIGNGARLKIYTRNYEMVDSGRYYLINKRGVGFEATETLDLTI